eukprot:1155900-Pelagomonas_calceolata.AAC.5
MQASRLVFVFVKDAKPKRKVAIPVPDGYLWQEFLQQVKSKLRIPGVKDIFLAAHVLHLGSLPSSASKMEEVPLLSENAEWAESDEPG